MLLLQDLDTPYVDLYLMHYPCTLQRGEERIPKGDDGLMIKDKTTYLDAWIAMEKLLRSGKTRAIGVSNFNRIGIQNLVDNSDTVSSCNESRSYVACRSIDSSCPSNGSTSLSPANRFQ